MFRRVMGVALALGLLAPATASAARPAVTTGGAASITPSTVTLNGKVDPNSKATTYFFQVGTTRLYGSNTAETPAGASANPSRVSVPVTGLAPSTIYHYRLVARNADGLTLGKDRTFKTKVQPLGVTLAAAPATVAPGGATTLAGQLTGTNNAGRQVTLLGNAYPYTGGFVPVGNPQVTAADGSFAFPVLVRAGDDAVPGADAGQAGGREPDRRRRRRRPGQDGHEEGQARPPQRDRALQRHRVAGHGRRARRHPEAPRRRLDDDRAHAGQAPQQLELAVQAAREAVPQRRLPRRSRRPRSRSTWPARAGRSTSRCAARRYPTTVRAACSRKRAA